MKSNKLLFLALAAFMTLFIMSCRPKNAGTSVKGDAAVKSYVAPGQYDEYYNFVSGGFSGQMSVYGLPSGRLFRVIPVFSVDPEKGWGYSEETQTYVEYFSWFCALGRLTPRRIITNYW
jgi:nitrous-oxide reductase